MAHDENPLYITGQLRVKQSPEPGKTSKLYTLEPSLHCPDLMTSFGRVYFIYNDTDTPQTRGKHYHKEGKTELMVCQLGKITVELRRGDRTEHVTLESPDTFLIVPIGVWHAVTLEPGAMLLVCAPTIETEGESIDDENYRL